MNKQYDVIIIGTGQAGVPLARDLVAAGKTVAVIERKRFGGTCPNVGCVPSKTLHASAKAIYDARNAVEFGITIQGTIKADLEAIVARKNTIIAPITKRENKFKALKNIDYYNQHARFSGTRSISVNSTILTAKFFFINVGARPRIPSYAHKVDFLTSTSILDLEMVPEHLIIIGAGAIGLEFGQMFARFGSKVTIVEMSSRILPREHEDVGSAVKQVLEAEGIIFRVNAECIDCNTNTNKIEVHLHCSKAEKDQLTGTHILFATGRQPNTDDLGLEKAGIKSNDNGYIDVNDFLETNVNNIWALGDCNGKGGFTHTAYHDYQIAKEQLLGNGKQKASDRISCWSLFIDPPLAQVGLSKKEALAHAEKADFLIAQMPMKHVARAIEKGDTRGFMEIIVHKQTKKILGATLFGIGADEVIHAVLQNMYCKGTFEDLRDAVHIHPTVAEYLPTLMEKSKPLK
ncbi:mercuric reductase [Aquimarina sp. U1-2]|uniref:mercuric reductase n=1 Tax=Aquimarina sp. U1-2 TaxID=2823141 RepID=UPI001AECE1B7|nr:mercuric reductase [Aquimarina sp. U1-2]MBP2833776.1 mercuric reductase [Aquimarina sp. U1-2]